MWRRGRPNGIEVGIGGLAWLVLLTVGTIIEPAADNPDAASGLAEVWATLAAVTMMATLVGFATRSKWAFATSTIASTILLAGVLACPTSGHHVFGPWWIGQLACVGGILAVGAWGTSRAGRIVDSL
jgi:hypothetical protein